jgi:hypothetical protein
MKAADSSEDFVILMCNSTWSDIPEFTSVTTSNLILLMFVFSPYLLPQLQLECHLLHQKLPPELDFELTFETVIEENK